MAGDVRGKVLGEGTISSDTFERAFENHEAIAEGNDYGIEFDFEGPNGFYLTDKGRKNADTSLAAMASITG